MTRYFPSAPLSVPLRQLAIKSNIVALVPASAVLYPCFDKNLLNSLNTANPTRRFRARIRLSAYAPSTAVNIDSTSVTFHLCIASISSWPSAAAVGRWRRIRRVWRKEEHEGSRRDCVVSGPFFTSTVRGCMKWRRWMSYPIE